MENRKARRSEPLNQPKMKRGAKKQLIIMLISIALMIFSATQVYYLAKYTLGHDVPQEKLGVYRWISMLLQGKENATIEE